MLSSIHAAFEKWLSLPNTDVIDVVAGAILANRIPGVPIWLVLVGPSGSGKSEMVTAIRRVKGVYPLSNLTPQTFLSGKAKVERSLLYQLAPDPTPIITMKDLTTLLSKNATDRDDIMGQMREVYDGAYSKAFGEVAPKRWEGKLGLIAACTMVYDEAAAQLSALGERFLVYRPDISPPMEIAEKAARTVSEDKRMQEELQEAMALLDGMNLPDVVPISYEVRGYLAKLCTFLAHMRTGVPREGWSHQIRYVPDVESTGRISKQLSQLIRGITIVKGHDEPYDEEVRLIEKVAMSSVPSMRLRIAKHLLGGGLSVRQLAMRTGIPKTVVGRELENMAVLGLIELTQSGYQPKPEHEVFFNLARKE